MPGLLPVSVSPGWAISLGEQIKKAPADRGCVTHYLSFPVWDCRRSKSFYARVGGISLDIHGWMRGGRSALVVEEVVASRRSEAGFTTLAVQAFTDAFEDGFHDLFLL